MNKWCLVFLAQCCTVQYRGLTQNLLTFNQIAQRADHTLFNSVKSPTHCLNQLPPPTRNAQHILRDRGHSYILPSCTFQLYIRCLFGYIVS